MPKSVFRRLVFFCVSVQFSCIISAAGTDDIVVVPKKIVDPYGYMGDLALDPTNGTLHCIWPNQYGALYYTTKTIDGVWGENEMIPTLGLPVTATDGAGWLRKSCGLTVDENGVVHVVYGVKDGDLYYVVGNSKNY